MLKRIGATLDIAPFVGMMPPRCPPNSDTACPGRSSSREGSPRTSRDPCGEMRSIAGISVDMALASSNENVVPAAVAPIHAQAPSNAISATPAEHRVIVVLAVKDVTPTEPE